MKDSGQQFSIYLLPHRMISCNFSLIFGAAANFTSSFISISLTHISHRILAINAPTNLKSSCSFNRVRGSHEMSQSIRSGITYTVSCWWGDRSCRVWFLWLLVPIAFVGSLLLWSQLDYLCIYGSFVLSVVARCQWPSLLRSLLLWIRWIVCLILGVGVGFGSRCGLLLRLCCWCPIRLCRLPGVPFHEFCRDASWRLTCLVRLLLPPLGTTMVGV